MSNRKLMILGVVAAVMAVLAVATSQMGKQGPSSAARNVNLVQGLDTSKIATIVLVSKDEETKITQKDGAYVVTNKENYPALVNEINGLVAEILDIKTLELVTSDPQNHKDLGVSEDAARYVVKFLDSEAKPIEGFGGIVISDTNADTQRVYVRLLACNDVYLVEGSPWPRMSSMDYIDKRLTSTEQEQIQSVTMTDPNGTYILQREGDSEEIVLAAGMPEGKKWKASTYRQVFGGLSSLEFTDVQSAGKAGDLAFDTTYEARLKDSTVYTFKIAMKDAKTFLTADATFTEEVTKPDASTSDEELKAKEAKMLTWEAAVKFHNRHQGWVYEIASYKAGDLTKPLADLLEDKKDETVASGAADAGGAATMPAEGAPVTDPNQP